METEFAIVIWHDADGNYHFDNWDVNGYTYKMATLPDIEDATGIYIKQIIHSF